MKTKYIGQHKFIEHNDRLYLFTDVSEQAICTIEWAETVLSRENVMFTGTGLMSHDIAGKRLENAEDILLNYLCI